MSWDEEKPKLKILRIRLLRPPANTEKTKSTKKEKTRKKEGTESWEKRLEVRADVSTVSESDSRVSSHGGYSFLVWDCLASRKGVAWFPGALAPRVSCVLSVFSVVCLASASVHIKKIAGGSRSACGNLTKPISSSFSGNQEKLFIYSGSQKYFCIYDR